MQKESATNLIKLFPEQINEKSKHTITLKEIKNEQDYLVIISFGKWLKLDCNRYFLGLADIKEHSLKGYGYTYYEFDVKNSMLAGTKMACPGYKNQNKFIKYNQSLTLPYNHKVPLIFYTSKDVMVEYQIYKKVKKGFASFE